MSNPAVAEYYNSQAVDLRLSDQMKALDEQGAAAILKALRSVDPIFDTSSVDVIDFGSGIGMSVLFPFLKSVLRASMT